MCTYSTTALRLYVRVVLPVVLVVVAGSSLNGQSPATWTLSDAPVLVIGRADGPEAELFQTVVAARSLSDQSVLVGDAGFDQIRIYDGTGRLQVRVGRDGQGPGEFLSIGGVWVVPLDSFAVWDSGTLRLTRFARDGSLGVSRRVGGDGLGNLEVLMTPMGEDVIIASLNLGNRATTPTPDRWVMSRFGPSGEFRSVVGSVRGMWRIDRQPIPFSPLPAVVAVDDTLFVSDGFEDFISVRDRSGMEVRRIGLPDDRPPRARGALERLSDQLAQLQGNGLNATLKRDILRRGDIPEPDEFPKVGGMLADDLGYLWVKSYEPATDALWLKRVVMRPPPGGGWRVFNTEGRWIAAVRLPDDFVPLDVTRNAILGVTIDGLGVERVVRYSLHRATGRR